MKTIQILYILAVPAITLLEIFGSPAHYLSNVFQCQSTQCLHLPQCSELTCWCLIIQCYAKLFIKENLLLAMYYKENCMWNSIIVTTVSWIAINDLILGFSSDSDIQQSSQSIGVFSQRTQILWLRGRQYGPKRNI
jgi:hypothetical protein